MNDLLVLGKKVKIVLMTLLSIIIFGCTPEVPETTSSSSSSNFSNFWNSNSSNNFWNDTNNDGVGDTYNYTDPLSEEYNFIFDENQQKLSIDIASDFNDNFLIRGNEVSNYVYNNESSINHLCFVIEYENSPENKAVIYSAKFKSTTDYSTGIEEFYLQVQGSTNTGTTDCAQESLIQSITADLQVAEEKLTYSMSELCTTCNTRFTDSSLRLYTPTGESVSDINLVYLSLYYAPQSQTTSSGPLSCTTSSECGAIGFNCCISGQCVNDAELKPGANESESYPVAYASTLANPESYSDFPEIYYVCPSAVASDPNSTSSSATTATDPVIAAQIRINKFEELYNCINPVQDEMSICSVRYENASQFIDRSDPTDPAGYTFEVPADDLNFAFTGLMDGIPNIVEVNYGGEILYKEGYVEANEAKVILEEDSINDDLESAMSVTVKSALANSALEDTIILKYRVDGSCEKLNPFLARCKKYYKQSQTSDPIRPSDHEEDNNSFLLPAYANLDYAVTVVVNGVNLPMGENTWEVGEGSVDFSQSIYPSQEVVVTYFVTDDNVAAVMASKLAAQTIVNTHCNCGTQNCNLDPVYVEEQGQQIVKSFNCVYPQNQQVEPPLQQVAYVSAKAVPLRFHDQYGISYDENISEAGDQEGNPFSYSNNNTLYPNNIQEYVGFNEVYGSFDKDSNSARPPKMIDVKKGRTYDLYVDQGSYSTCTTCGSDYFSALQKIFPTSFLHKGGGYGPDWVESSRVDNRGKFRADDLIFGRACFLPATMIPLTHVPSEDLATQRAGRLSAQHFLYANGYNRDWYGFDMGSLIGSFDGVKWFAVGNMRRIKADTNKLFLAVNGYFGDLTANNDYKVIVSEMSVSSGAGNVIDHDLESDGAECQLYHLCQSDNDCVKNLGYEYTCEAVSGITTSWPSFDVNANEIPGTINYRLLASLVGGVNGKPKRCVYRGRGSACLQDPYDTSASYMGSLSPALHKCSPNTYCQTLDGDAFNNKIARFAKPPATQNINETLMELTVPTDTFGQSARILGRPYDYFGQEATNDEAGSVLSENGIESICIPGKTASESDMASANATAPDGPSADRTLGIGITSAEESSAQYYSVCPTTDDNGNFLGKSSNLALDDVTLMSKSASQNISSNVLQHEDFSSLEIFNDANELITERGLNKNTCLRAPGASCFTDMDCAPSSFIADQVGRLNFNPINEAEGDFWKEGLVCGQDKEKYLPLTIQMNPDYKLSDNKCCREIGKTITVHSADHEDASFYADKVAGVEDGISIMDEMRNSRVQTIIDKLQAEPSKYPPLIGPKADAADPMDLSEILHQYNTFHLAASRTCCSGNWVRKFSETNGDSNSWNEGKNQTIPKSAFKCISWEPDNGANISLFNSRFQCHRDNWVTVECEIKSLSPTEQDFYLSWLEKFELTGIPQIAIETNEDVYCKVDYTTQADVTSSKVPLKGTILSSAIAEITDGSKDYLSAGDMSNFKTAQQEDDDDQGEIKQVFSPNKVNCCLPSGQQVASSVTDQMCCTGKVFQNKCCLQDYTDVTVYLNRYVSSEASHLNDSLIDPATGYIKDPGTVMQLASERNICCSGKLSYGHAIHKLMIPGAETEPDAKTTRFVYSNNTTDNNNETGNIAEVYDKGVTWNNHVYCVPTAFQDPPIN
jgi:hypothetical protein